MSQKVKDGPATSPVRSPLSAASMTVDPAKRNKLIQILKAEGVPFVNGQPNASPEQLYALQNKLAAEGVVFE